MKRTLVFALGTLLASGCSLDIPNGVFSCVSGGDCPEGYFCWNNDSRCYDAEEPELQCQPGTCQSVIAQFASLGVEVGCGQLPDGCGGVAECPSCAEGETCGANGQSFVCGCEERSCSTIGAQCGTVAVGCGSTMTVECGECPGALECRDHRCVCASGDCECPQGCSEGQICVSGECCAPRFPCSENACSPQGSFFEDGCGGTVVCPPCGPGETCEPDSAGERFDCVPVCSCESEGIECGTTTLCGSPLFCGVCSDTGSPLCENGRCVCADQYESNDDATEVHRFDCGGACSAASLELEASGTLHSEKDFDFFEVVVAHRGDYAIRLDVSGLRSTRQILLGYRCPGGSEGISDCSGSSSSFGGSKYCIEDGADTLRLRYDCDDSGGGNATVIAAVSAKEGEFRGPCDAYSLRLSSYPYDD